MNEHPPHGPAPGAHRPTIWTLHQINAVRRRSYRHPIAHQDELAERWDETKDAIARQLGKALASLGTTIHPEDIEYSTEYDILAGTLVVARWNPATMTVELVSPRGTEVIDLARTRHPHMGMPTTITVAAHGHGPLQYTHTGWHEHDRRWIYTASTGATNTPQAGTTPGAPQSNPPGPGVPPGPGKAARIPHSAPTT